jgi:hypothetical protein
MALRNMGHHTELICEPSWRANRESVLNLATMVNDKLQEVKIDAVIFCGVDNSVYYGLNDAGETSLPKKDKEGHYHVEGDLIVCSKSAQHALFNRRSRFLKVDNRYENLGCGSNPKTILLNTFFKICSRLLRK